MLWEIADYFKKLIKMTVIPALRNLFSSFKSLVGMLLVMFVMQMLLSVICIFGVENIKSQQAVLKNFNALISSSNIQTGSSSFTFLPETLATALSSTSIFIGALAIWGVCALTVYQKVTFACADRDKYIWGMYVTHGAKSKKVKAMLKCELYLPHLIATAAAYPASLYILNYLLSSYGLSYTPNAFTVISVLVISYVCIRLIVEYESILIKNMSCTDMLKEEDAPKSVCFPRRHSKLIFGFTPARYGTNTFIRMRKYYISLAAIAAIPALIWICFQVSATSEDMYISSSVNEFTVKLEHGMSASELESMTNKAFSSLDGVDSVKADASYRADLLGSYIMADRSHFEAPDELPLYGGHYANGKAVICAYNKAFKQGTGVSLAKVREGTVTVVCPTTDSAYSFEADDKITAVISRKNGEVSLFAGEEPTLENQYDDGYDRISLTVGSVVTCHEQMLSGTGFTYVDKTYFVLNDSDYERMTSISPKAFSQEIFIEDVIAVDKTLAYDASFNIILKKSALQELPREGDCLEVEGRYKMTLTLTELPAYEDPTPTVWTKTVSESFDYAYINAVRVNGDMVTLEVTPYDIITIHSGAGAIPSVYLALGTPPLDTTPTTYFASTCTDRLVLSNTSVSIQDNLLEIHTMSDTTGDECGAYLMMHSKNLSDEMESSLELIETLHADSDLYVTSADSSSAIGLMDDIPCPSPLGVVLVLPDNMINQYKFAIGDKLRIAITQQDVAAYDPNALIYGSSFDALTAILNEDAHEMLTLYVENILYNNDISDPHIIMTPEIFSVIINEDAPYTSFSIYVSAHLDSEEYAELRQNIGIWAARQLHNRTSVTSTGEFLRQILHKNANYSTILSLIAMIIPLIVPFIWYYPLSSLFDRRRTELYLLEAMGKKRSHVSKAFLVEGMLVCICAFITVILLCYPAMFFFKTVCDYCKIPLEFEYSALSAPTLVLAAVFSCISAALSFAICFLSTMTRRRKNRKAGR